MTTTIEKVRLGDLLISPKNVRADSEPDASIPALAASIQSVGLLQPLIGTRSGKSESVYIEAGRRRLLAYEHLRDQLGNIDDDHLVEVKIVDEADAEKVSLIENVMREEMSERELYPAYLAIAEANPELSADDIGNLFGYDGARVRRILALAKLHPTLRDLWLVDGKLSFEQAKAFTLTPDQDLQMKIWEGLVADDQAHREEHGYGSNCLNAANIRSAMKEALAPETTKIKKAHINYLGLDAYTEAGGRLERDLFGDDVIILDVDLFAKLVDEKVQAELQVDLAKAAKAARRPKTVFEPFPDDRDPHDCWSLRVKSRELDESELTKPEAKKLAKLRAKLAEIEATDDEDDEAWEVQDAIEELLNVLDLPEDRPVYCRHAIDYSGNLTAELYDLDRPGQENSKALSESTGTKSQSVRRSFEDDIKDEGFSRKSFLEAQYLHGQSIATILVDEGLQGSDIGLDFMLFHDAWGLVKPHMMGGPSALSETRSPDRGNYGISTAIKDAGDAINLVQRSGLHDFEWAKQTDMGVGWHVFREWMDDGSKPKADKRALLGGIIAASRLHYVPNVAQAIPMPKMMAVLVGELSGGSDSEQAQLLPVPSFARYLSHKARMALLTSWGISTTGLKAQDSLDRLTLVLTDDDEGADARKLLGVDDDTYGEIISWVPKGLDALDAAAEVMAKLAEAKAPPKAKAKKPRATSAKAKNKEPADA